MIASLKRYKGRGITAHVSTIAITRPFSEDFLDPAENIDEICRSDILKIYHCVQKEL